jgi:peptidyl-prolyl cis-trans isomerase B (cyclophilin B)
VIDGTSGQEDHRVATSSTRQRKLARAKLDRQLAKRAERERRKRQIRAVAAGVTTLAVAVLGGMWIGGVFEKKPEPPPVANDCTWNPQNVSANQNLKEVGTPPATGVPSTGTPVTTLTLNAGTIGITLDRANARCGSASLAFLAGQGFYNNTKCHELTNGENGQYALRCGDPSSTGNGGAAYTWSAENVPPKAPAPASPEASASPGPSAAPSASAAPSESPSTTPRYPRGTVAMQPGLTGSQFLIFYKDSPAPDADYSVVGYVTTGLDVLEKIAAAGTVDNGSGANTKPKDEITIQTLTVVDSTEPSAAPSIEPSTEPSTQPSPSATPSS